MKSKTILVATLFCVLQINASSTTEKNGDYPSQDDTQQSNNHQNNYDTYASSFPYTTSSPVNTKQNINTHHPTEHQDTQRQLPPEFSNYDTNHHHGSFNNENQDPYSVRPKPVIKYTDEQLNLPNPYLVNSNIPKDGENIPCPLYYPCRRNTEFEEDLNHQRHQPKVELTPTLQSQIPRYPEPNWINQRFPQSNSVYNEPTTNIFLSQSEYTKQQNSNNEGKFDNSQVTIVCYGLDCSTQVKSSDNFEPISIKSDGENLQIPSYTSEIIKNFESQILKAIINDLQYIRALTSSFSASNKADNDYQKPITVESQLKGSNPSSNVESATFRTAGPVYA